MASVGVVELLLRKPAAVKAESVSTMKKEPMEVVLFARVAFHVVSVLPTSQVMAVRSADAAEAMYASPGQY